MSEVDKVLPSHLHRLALVYVRQSSQAQVEHNRESTLRQYALTERAAALGWPAARITVIDDDLGLSGSSAHHRGGFARMAADVMWASSSGWRSRAWRATTPIGTDCSIFAP